MDAINFLIKEHDRVRKMLSDMENLAHHDETKRKMFDELSADLIRHETMEQTVWYPHFRNDHRIDDEVKHLLTEEKDAEKAIKKLDNIEDQNEWEAKFIKFKKAVEHHADEEEEKLFPRVRKILSEEDLKKIGKDMFDFKQNWEAKN